MEPQEQISVYMRVIGESLEEHTPAEQGAESDLYRAIRYSISGGKRVRPLLTLGSAEAIGGDPQSVAEAAVAIEFIHTCSLILDDLPSMDNATHRRGRLATHSKFGEATAILAAHALLTEAFGLLARNARKLPIGKEATTDIIDQVASSLGISGLSGGQYLDLQVARNHTGWADLDAIHSQKTAALFVAAVCTGAALCGAGERETTLLTSYAEDLGLAFQEIDDLLDKEVAVDVDGLAARGHASMSGEAPGRLIERAKKRLQPLGPAADTLLHLADVITAHRPG